MKLDRELRKEWIVFYSFRHHSGAFDGFGRGRAAWKRRLDAMIRRMMRQRRADRKTQQQQRRNTR